jgi:hypothetical protein
MVTSLFQEWFYTNLGFVELKRNFPQAIGTHGRPCRIGKLQVRILRIASWVLVMFHFWSM